MGKMTISLNQTTDEAIKALELPKQAKEILVFLNNELGTNAIDQKDLFELLDSHQEDNKVLSVTPKQPISRIFQFYRKRLADEGVITIVKEAAPPKEPKVAGEKKTGGSSKRRRKDADIEEGAEADVL